ncbi:RmlC-like cupin domain-containing protein [Apodospora peruviana]|uniref:RmlC-like cupin domain-containing protein n=1 Tax=Apodospora peruviana TaxID=516989 RepID=A0AAE0M7F2_9PEZI|nr:RmlC-like cupin domain-containing protein [Apodospora peruviana]
MYPYLVLLVVTSVANAAGTSLWVPTTPQSPKPYAIKKGLGIAMAGGNTYPVTGNSSGKAFCILNTNAGPTPGASGVFPHVHKKTYENFYSAKGRVQLWGQNLDAYHANTSIQQTRILGPGDIGAIPPNTIHTFTLLEPDTQLTGVLVPGGFEEFFFNMNIPPSGPPDSESPTLPGAGGFDMDGLAKWDVYPQLDFVPRHDVVNGKAGPGNWYDGANSLASGMSEPIWVAKNYGPKFLNSQDNRHHIITPFVTGLQTNNTFSQGTITLSPFSRAETRAPVVKSAVATAFMMEEGQLEVTVEGFEPASLIDGDIVFVPPNTPFSYVATAEFTKFMYVTGGGAGLDAELMAKAKPWDSAFYPPQSSNLVVKRGIRI